MKDSSRLALGGLSASLSLTLMLLTYVLPILTYTSPAFAGAVLLVMVCEVDSRWSWITYTAVSLLSLLLLSDKEAAVMYAVFFGYYPILLPFLNTRVRPAALRWVIKFLIFNAAVVSAYYVLINVMGLTIEGLKEHGSIVLWAGLAALNLLFVLYDRMLVVFFTVYKNKWSKSFRKLFKR
ncbi:MAG: hypothetical protein K6C36_03750 [Clostridia bacterium]|nr:hypothetical protein [Clostridia bacterium]